MPSRNVNVNNRENPFGTLEGQEIVSTSETFWARLGRLGTPAFKYGSIAFTTSTSTIAFAGNWFKDDHVLYLQHALISADADVIIGVAMYPAGSGSNYQGSGTGYQYQCFLKAGTPLLIPFDGSQKFVREDNDTLNAQFRLQATAPTGGAGGKVYVSIVGIQIARNDL